MSDTPADPRLAQPTLDKAIADARKAAADADQAEATLRSSRITSMIPDLSKFDNGAVTTSDSQGMHATLLGHHALDVAADRVIAVVRKALGNRSEAASILVTDKADLAAIDGTYREVIDGLVQLIGAADTLIKEVDEAGNDRTKRAALLALPLLGAIAAAVPSVAAMFASTRSLKSFPITADTTAAIAVTVGKLLEHTNKVDIDDFRLVPTQHIGAMEVALRERRLALVRRKLEADRQRSDADTRTVTSQETVDRLTKALEATDLKDSDRRRLEQDLRDAESERDTCTVEGQHGAVIVGLIDGLSTSIDTFVTSIHTAPAAGRSPLVQAALYEQLHPQPLDPATVPDHHTVPVDPTITHVLYLKALSGSLDQLVDDRKFLSDKIDETASVEICYWMLDCKHRTLIASGVAIGTARRHGKIDDDDLPITCS